MTFPSETANRLEARIRTARLIDVPAAWADELVFPAYNGLSILNVIHTTAELLGAPLPYSRPLDGAVWDGAPPTPSAINRVVLIISDGLSYRWLNHFMQEDGELARSVAALSGGRGPVPLTSVVPSTTSTALTTLWTGVSGAVHGIPGFRVYLREIDTHAIPLFFRPIMGNMARDALVTEFGLNPMTFLPVRGFGEHLASAGVPTYPLVRQEYIGSALTNMLQRGIPYEHYYAHTANWDEWLRLRQLLADTRGRRCYVNVYMPAVDTVSHGYGAGSAEVAYTVRRQMAELAAVLADQSVQDGHTLVMLIADHGHHDAPDKIDLHSDPQAGPIAAALRGYVSGEARFAYISIRSAQKQAVLDTLNAHYSSRIAVLDPAEALAAGLFGPEPPYRETIHRLGDLILIPRLGVRLDRNPPPNLISVHGGMSDWEMLVPFLWRRL